MYMFLFDDILLLTRVKKAPRKKQTAVDQSSPFAKVQTDGAIFLVHRQPIALDRFVVHDVRPVESNLVGGVFWDYVESSYGLNLPCPEDSHYPGGSNASNGDNASHRGDSCLPHLYEECSPSAQKANLLFGCVSAASVLKNALTIVQVNRFQQIIGVYTLQAPNYSSKAQWMSRLHDAQEAYKESLRKGPTSSKRPSRDNIMPELAVISNDFYLESPDTLFPHQPTRPLLLPPALPRKLDSLVIPGAPDSMTSRRDSKGISVDDDVIPKLVKKLRSCSSDAATSLHGDGGDEEIDTSGGLANVRRTSDPVHLRNLADVSNNDLTLIVPQLLDASAETKTDVLATDQYELRQFSALPLIDCSPSPSGTADNSRNRKNVQDIAYKLQCNPGARKLHTTSSALIDPNNSQYVEELFNLQYERKYVSQFAFEQRYNSSLTQVSSCNPSLTQASACRNKMSGGHANQQNSPNFEYALDEDYRRSEFDYWTQIYADSSSLADRSRNTYVEINRMLDDRHNIPSSKNAYIIDDGKRYNISSAKSKTSYGAVEEFRERADSSSKCNDCDAENRTDNFKKMHNASLRLKRRTMMKTLKEKSQSIDNF